MGRGMAIGPLTIWPIGETPGTSREAFDASVHGPALTRTGRQPIMGAMDAISRHSTSPLPCRRTDPLGPIGWLAAAWAAGLLSCAAAPDGQAPPLPRAVQLTQPSGVSEESPVFLAGRTIAFLRPSRAPGPPECRRELWMVGADGRHSKRILGPGCFHLRLSPRQDWLACSRHVGVRPVRFRGQLAGWEGKTEVWAAPASGTSRVRVTPPGGFFLDGWSPDGRLYLHEGRLGYDDLEGFHEATGFPPLRAWCCLPSLPVPPTPVADLAATAPFADRDAGALQWRRIGIWAPDGSGCIRVRRFRRGGIRRIAYDFARPGQPARRVLDSREWPDSADGERQPAVAWVDARRVLLQRFWASPDARPGQPAGRHYLVLAYPASGAFRVLAPQVRAAACPDPVVSPTGDRVLFRAQPPGGEPELWIAAVSGRGCRRVLDGDASYTRWAWSPDGKSLVVARDGERGGDLWRVDVR